MLATNTNEKTIKHDYFNHINIAYRFTIFQLDTQPFCFLFFVVVLSFYPHTIHKTSKLWFLPYPPPLLPPTCLWCLALTHKKQSFRASPKIVVQQLVVTCIKLIITKQIMMLVTFWNQNFMSLENLWNCKIGGSKAYSRWE